MIPGVFCSIALVIAIGVFLGHISTHAILTVRHRAIRDQPMR